MAPIIFGFKRGECGCADLPMRFIMGQPAVVRLNIFASPEPSLKLFQKMARQKGKEKPETTTTSPVRGTAGNDTATIPTPDPYDDGMVFVPLDVGDPDHPDIKNDPRKRKEEEEKDIVWLRDEETYKVTGFKVKEVDTSGHRGYKVEAINKFGKQEVTLYTHYLRDVDLYKSPLGQDCANPDVGFQRLDRYPETIKQFVLMKRSYVALYAIGLFLGLLGLINICVGCAWVRALPVGSSAVMLMLAACCLAAAGGVWHKADDTYRSVPELDDRHTVNQYNYNQWIPELQDATKVSYGWSMIIHWVGTGLILIAALLSLIGCFTADRYHRKKKDMKREEQTRIGINPVDHEMHGQMPIQETKVQYTNQGYVADSKMAQALAPYGTYSGYGGNQAQMYPGYNTYAGYSYPFDPYYGMQTYSHYGQ